MMPDRLMKPDEYGNFWLGLSRQSCPAIFPAKSPCAPKGSFIASFGGERGFLWQGTTLRYFASPQQALDALRQAELVRN